MATDRLLEAPAPGDGVGKPNEPGESGDQIGRTNETAALDEWADDLRQEHLRNALDNLDDLDVEQRAAVAECSRAIVDEILRCPRWRLRNDGSASSAAVAALFDLD